ncbi:MAG: HPr family phosphocarrier protein [Desulfobacterota bacterium]|nr:HPr family phosphocarrier protein [Thermodesulfobacteriota bacterium]
MQFVVEIISEEDFIARAKEAARSFLSFGSYLLRHADMNTSKRLYVTCVKEATELEDFLDDHGARNNKQWLFFGELVASIRNISSTAYLITHMLSRIKFYRLNATRSAAFIKDANKVLEFLYKALHALFSEALQEAERRGLTMPTSNITEESFQDSIVTRMLPQNIDTEGSPDIHGSVTRIATDFIAISNACRSILIEKKVSTSKIDPTLIPSKINEETLRNFESRMHNAQSMYDTYIQKTPFESENELLPQFRGHISITLHLLGVARELCHFFERHVVSIRHEASRKKISKLVPRDKIFNVIINFALYFYTQFLRDGHAIAEQLLKDFTVVETITVPVPQGLGFHLRPSTLVAKIVNHYGSKVTMLVNGREFDAGSVIDIMWAGGMIKKEGVSEVMFRGDKNAVRDLKILAEANYGEDTMGTATPLPPEIAYLRQD